MKRKFILPALLLFQWGIVSLIRFFPAWIETYYSQGLYPKIAYLLRTALGGLPFSVGDVLYTLLVLVLVHWFWKNRIGFWKHWKTHFWTLLSFLSVLYFCFHVLWGLNYYRLPLHEKWKLEKEYTYEELVQFTRQLVVQTNALQKQIQQDTTQAVRVVHSEATLFNMAPKGYAVLASKHPEFYYESASIKGSLYSLPLSYMGFGGYLNPFTNEAQVNSLKPKYTAPLTICHEMAHQTGVASESECNFMGFLAASQHPDVYFRYSAYTFALNYCLFHLEEQKAGSSQPFKKWMNKGVLQNFKESKTFWQHHQTVIANFFEYFYDHFLKWNQQKEGLESYSKFIGLLINYNKHTSVFYAH